MLQESPPSDPVLPDVRLDTVNGLLAAEALRRQEGLNLAQVNAGPPSPPLQPIPSTQDGEAIGRVMLLLFLPTFYPYPFCCSSSCSSGFPSSCSRIHCRFSSCCSCFLSCFLLSAFPLRAPALPLAAPAFPAVFPMLLLMLLPFWFLLSLLLTHFPYFIPCLFPSCFPVHESSCRPPSSSCFPS